MKLCLYKFLRDIFVHFKILFIIITCLEYLIKVDLLTFQVTL